jgi:hypothetical protein
MSYFKYSLLAFLFSASGVVEAAVYIPPSVPSAVAQLPLKFLNSNVPALNPNRHMLRVGAAQPFKDCQAAIVAAQPGDEIVIDARFVCGPIRLVNKGSSTFVTLIRSLSSGYLPTQGTRLRRTDANLLAIIQTPNTAPAITAEPGAHHYYLLGLEVRPVSTQTAVVDGLISFGSSTETSDAQFPHDIVIARSYVHGYPRTEVKRGIALNAARISVVDSIVEEIHGLGLETQAIGGWNGRGPFKIVNNELSAATENVMFGGARTSIPDLIPSDIEFRKNFLQKPLSWMQPVTANRGVTGQWVVKNIFELKNAQRVLVDGNVMQNCWIHGQLGFAVVLTPRSETVQPWVRVQDVVFTNNIVRGSAGGINLLYADNYNSSAIAQRLLITNNLFYDIGRPDLGGNGRMIMVSGDDQGPVQVTHNTFLKYPTVKSGGFVVGAGQNAGQLQVQDNLVLDEAYGVIQNATAPGAASLAALGFDTNRFARNVIAGQTNPAVYGNWQFFNNFISGAQLPFYATYTSGIDYHLLQYTSQGANITTLDRSFTTTTN